ncbi:hypothetical protein HYY69_00870 [Candidatus Woesearchaeota archaeon]|nr:hypothetical protein [Candidatus Woesearchaeota archaeon]
MASSQFQQVVVSSFHAARKDIVKLHHEFKALENQIDVLKLENNRLSNKVHQLEKEQDKANKHLLEMSIDVDGLRLGKKTSQSRK